jgi:hypothetical protein
MRRPGGLAGRRPPGVPGRPEYPGYFLASMLLIALIPLENGSSPCSGT